MNPSNNDSQTPFGIGAIPPINDQTSVAADPITQQPLPPSTPDQATNGTSLPVAVPVDPVASALADIPSLTPPPSSGADSMTPLPSQATAGASLHSPQIAEDVDLIEKEWVTKAKAIINSTRGNPHEQSKELSRFKADYLKTRYSKDVKVNDK